MDPSLADPIYLVRLYKRLTGALLIWGKRSTSTESKASLQLSPFFLSVDQRHRDPSVTMALSEVLDVVRPILSVSALSPASPRSSGGLSAKDLQLLPALLCLEALCDREGLVAPGEVLYALLQVLPQQAFLLDQIVLTARRGVSMLPQPPPLEERLYRRLANSPAGTSTVRGRDVITFLLELPVDFTVSQVLMLVDYCRVDDDTDVSPDRSVEDEDEWTRSPPKSSAGSPLPSLALLNAPLDADLIYRLCFQVGPLDSAVAFPLLAAQFAEGAVEPAARDAFENASGSRFVLLALERLTATSNSEPLHQRRVRLKEFRQLCEWLGAPTHIQTPLFECLCDSETKPPSCSVERIMSTFFEFFPCKSEPVVELYHGALVRCMRQAAQQQDQLVFCELFRSWRCYGAGPIPIMAYLDALRRVCGAGARLFSDIELESLRCVGDDRVSLLWLLISPVAPGRDAVVQKILQSLPATGEWTRLLVLDRFRPEKIEGSGPQRKGQRWKEALKTYLDEFIDEGEGGEWEATVSADELAFFFYLLSAGVEDSPSFTMMLWQGFGLADGISKMGLSRAPR